MTLTEIKSNYVTSLINKVTITSDQTRKSYISVVNKFCSINTRPYRTTKDELKQMLSGIRIKYSDSYYNIYGSALKILFEDVLNQPFKMSWFKSIPTKLIFHDIISKSEFIEMGRRCTNSKQKVIHVLLYSTGIRLSEMLNIKIDDIDFVGHRIYIKSVKKGKNRNVPIHPLLLRYLRIYFKEWHPKIYLLNGQKSLQYSPTSVQKIIFRISNGKYHPHSYRHTMLSNFIEHENVFKAKELAGHNNLKSTLIYYHISQKELINMYNPLDDIRRA